MAKRMMVWVVAVVVAMAGGASATSCNTNRGSPTQGEANNAVQYIRKLKPNTECCQQHCGGDFCTVMFQNSGARVLICGPCNKCTSCTTAGNALNKVLAECTRNIGGTARCAGNDHDAGFAFVIDIARRVTNAIGDPIDIELETQV